MQLSLFKSKLRSSPWSLSELKDPSAEPPLHQEFDINPIDIAYFSSHEDHEDRGIRKRGPFQDDLSDLNIE